jgi:DHA2 family multidrug resistance protein
MINQQALTISNDEILLASAYIFLLLIPVIWLAKPPFMTSRSKKKK